MIGKKILRGFAFLLLGALLLVGSLRLLVSPLRDSIPWSSAVYAENDELLRLTLSADSKFRVYTPLSKFPRTFVETILFKEDRFFRMHWGVNPWAVARAVGSTYLRGGKRIGGSTISMQLARLMYGHSSRSIPGKLRQMSLALWLELAHSKDDILEAYLNLLPYSANVEGAGTASLVYFGKPPEQLNTPEIFTLAVIPQSPRLRTVGAEGEIQTTHELIQARDRLFSQWSAEHNISDEERVSFRMPFRMRGTKQLPFKAPHFTEEILAASGGTQTEFRTTLNSSQQKILQDRLSYYVRRNKKSGVDNAAALLIDSDTNQIRAMVGSTDFFNSEISGQVNGTAASRSPGSTLKPLAYALAMDQGLIHPQSLLKDAPTSFGGFDPENFDREFLGPVFAEEALTRSRNLPAVSLTAELKNPTFYEFLKSAGIKNMKPPEYYGLSTVLGGLEITMQDLVSMYSAFANRGVQRSLQRLKIEKPQTLATLLSPEASFLVLDMLKHTQRPAQSGGSPWSQSSVEVAWKTGTSHGFRDAWTVGLFGHYVLAVWVGNFDGSGNPAFIGKDIAAPLFFEMVEALKPREKLEFAPAFTPELNIKKVQVCAVSGKIPGPHCHHLKWTYFIPGKSPIASCDIHREVEVDPSGHRLCTSGQPGAEKKVYEFWPSDLLKLFKQAGIPRIQPPPWDPSCNLGSRLSQGTAPKILSPKLDITYSLRATEAAHEVSLSAIADADVREVFWFINDAFIGKAKPRDSLFWKIKPGHHVVRVVDDQGRSDARPLDVVVVE